MSRTSLQAKRWNEHIRLTATFLNVTSIGVFGLAVTAPLLRRLGTSGELLNSQQLATSEIGSLSWEAAAFALLLHLGAHILVGLTVEED